MDDLKYLFQHGLIGLIVYLVVLNLGLDLAIIMLTVVLSDYLLHNLLFEKKK